MKLFTALTSMLPALVTIKATQVNFDYTYDNRDQSLATVACSDGANGLLTRGFTTFGSLPTFPFIGGAPSVTGWNSPGCGACWNIVFNDDGGVARSINVIVLDVASPDFSLSLTSMNELTNGKAIALDRVPVTATQMPGSVCGL